MHYHGISNAGEQDGFLEPETAARIHDFIFCLAVYCRLVFVLSAYRTFLSGRQRLSSESSRHFGFRIHEAFWEPKPLGVVSAAGTRAIGVRFVSDGRFEPNSIPDRKSTRL